MYNTPQETSISTLEGMDTTSFTLMRSSLPLQAAATDKSQQEDSSVIAMLAKMYNWLTTLFPFSPRYDEVEMNSLSPRTMVEAKKKSESFQTEIVNFAKKNIYIKRYSKFDLSNVMDKYCEKEWTPAVEGPILALVRNDTGMDALEISKYDDWKRMYEQAKGKLIVLILSGNSNCKTNTEPLKQLIPGTIVSASYYNVKRRKFIVPLDEREIRRVLEAIL